MNVVNVLHNKAMEFADEAEIAKRKESNENVATLYLKAFRLEKEAAMNTPLDHEDNVPRHILLRSATSLAMLSEQYEEAEKLILLGLTSSPPDFIKEELQELALEVKSRKKQRTEDNQIQLVGLFIYVNASLNEIKIQEVNAALLYTLIAPSHLLREVVKKHFLERVNVKANLSSDGILLLTEMQKAA